MAVARTWHWGSRSRLVSHVHGADLRGSGQIGAASLQAGRARELRAPARRGSLVAQVIAVGSESFRKELGELPADVARALDRQLRLVLGI